MVDFTSDLRISHKWMLVILALLGMLVLFVSDNPADPSDQTKLLLLAGLFYAVAAIGWLLDRWQPWLSRWFTIVALVALIYAGHLWLNGPGFLTLLVIPTALAAALISLPAAMAMTIGETVLLLLTGSLDPDLDLTTTIITLVPVWTILGVMYVVYQPVHQLAQWSWNHFQQAQISLEEARDRKEESEQALDDLAQANLQLTRMNLLAQGLRQAADAARRAKEEFVANVSHELRTPLNMITGFSEMILQAPKLYGRKMPSALLADLTVIHRNARHLADLVDDVLDLSQIETGQMALTKEQVQFQEIVQAVTVAVRPLFESKGLYLETEIPADLPPLFCDRTRIREVLLNLLSNAGRFTERGGVTLRAWLKEKDIVVSVIDTGTGIAAEDMDKLFQPFQQVDASIRRRYGGTGLGLNISKRFIELHGGKIWVESAKDVGTTFSFRLPTVLSRPAENDFIHTIVPGWEFFQRTRPSRAPKIKAKPRFVLLETGDSLKRLVTRYLDGVEVVSVTSLEKAITEILASPSQAFLINDMSPERVLNSLDVTTLPDGIPTMVCSVPGMYESAGIMGVSDYLVKPISQDDLLAALHRLDLPGKTVLIADDEPDALQLFRRMLFLSGENYRVLRARDGSEAISMLCEHHPDVLLLDLTMPNMDGFQVLKAKSEDETVNDIPVIIISARDPFGQPIVSHTLTVTSQGGLSMQRLLACIKNISEAFAVFDPMPEVTSPD